MFEESDVKVSKNIFKIKTPSVVEHDKDLAALIDYWQRMRRGQDVPLRTEIDPRGIEGLLSNAFIAEKVTPGLARMRVAGTHLSNLLGMEIRGMPVSSLIEPDHRNNLSDAIVELFERPARLQIELTSKGSYNAPPMQGTMLILPLRSDLGDISRALGCLVTTGEIGKGPRRFEITDIQINPVKIPNGVRAQQFSEAQVPYTAQDEPTEDRPLGPSERPYLRLIHSS
ncbi:MAG: PAS domain-containing protein [Pseudomonadota bacterium]